MPGSENQAVIAQTEQLFPESPSLQKILSLERAREVAERYRTEGKMLVGISGVWDILHDGHIMALEEAKRSGDKLFVACNSDVRVRQLKGPTRPVKPDYLRARVLGALETVDYVIITDDPLQFLQAIVPQVFFMSLSSTKQPSERAAENEFIAQHGIRVIITPKHSKEFSSTSLMNKILESNGEDL